MRTWEFKDHWERSWKLSATGQVEKTLHWLTEDPYFISGPTTVKLFNLNRTFDRELQCCGLECRFEIDPMPWISLHVLCKLKRFLWFCLVVVVLFAVLRIVPRASCMLGKHNTTELYPQPAKYESYWISSSTVSCKNVNHYNNTSYYFWQY
jgi:hypothetical protein